MVKSCKGSFPADQRGKGVFSVLEIVLPADLFLHFNVKSSVFYYYMVWNELIIYRFLKERYSIDYSMIYAAFKKQLTMHVAAKVTRSCILLPKFRVESCEGWNNYTPKKLAQLHLEMDGLDIRVSGFPEMGLRIPTVSFRGCKSLIMASTPPSPRESNWRWGQNDVVLQPLKCSPLVMYSLAIFGGIQSMVIWGATSFWITSI